MMDVSNKMAEKIAEPKKTRESKLTDNMADARYANAGISDAANNQPTPPPAVDDVRQAVRTLDSAAPGNIAQTSTQTSTQTSNWQESWPGVWAKMTAQFRAEFGETSYRRFLASLKGVKYQDGVFTFRAENFFQAEWVKKNYRYWLLQRFQIEKWQVSDIDFVMGSDMGSNMGSNMGSDAPSDAPHGNDSAKPTPPASGTMSGNVVGDITLAAGTTGEATSAKSKKLLGSELLPQFAFNKLVVGDSNEEAINAAKQMLDNFPKLPFNPLFIHGAVGFGKTHLLNAIGHYLKQRHPEKKFFISRQRIFYNILCRRCGKKKFFLLKAILLMSIVC